MGAVLCRDIIQGNATIAASSTCALGLGERAKLHSGRRWTEDLIILIPPSNALINAQVSIHHSSTGCVNRRTPKTTRQKMEAVSSRCPPDNTKTRNAISHLHVSSHQLCLAARATAPESAASDLQHQPKAALPFAFCRSFALYSLFHRLCSVSTTLLLTDLTAC